MFNNKYFILILLWIGLSPYLFSQLKLTISTNKSSYNYGDIIHVYCTVENIGDTTVTIMSGSYNSCQAEFSFNNYNSSEWDACLPTTQQLIFPPQGEKIYAWTINPQKFGLPNKDGEQTLIGYFLGGLRDTIHINAPLYNGGELLVGYNTNNINYVYKLKNSLKIIVIDSIRYDNLHNINETWQLNGKPIDTLFAELKKDTLLNSVEYNRSIHYDSIYVTDVKQIDLKQDHFKLYYAYPNPFNPSTTIRYEIPKESKVTIRIFSFLGKEVATLLNSTQNAGKHQVEWNAKGLSSGIYFYQIRAGDFIATKKMLLIK